MASTMYVKSINLTPTNYWYDGLEVTLKCVVGCLDTPCENCRAGVNVGLSKSTSVAPGYAPKSFTRWEWKYGEPSCGGTETVTFTHVITQDDIDLVNDGVDRCCVFIAGGLDNKNYKYDNVHVVDICDGVVCDPKCFGDDLYTTVCQDGDCVRGALIENNAEECKEVTDPGKGDLISVVAEPTSGSEGDRIYIYATIKNVGGSSCLLKLKVMEGSNEITNSGKFGWVAAGQTIEDIMMQMSMLDHTANLTVQVVRSE